LKDNVNVKVQRFGSTLSSMIMPNIGAFIAWGLITALFIPTGWLPNDNLVQLVDPMIIYLLPLLIGYTGGKNVYDTRGGVVGATATIGVIVGADIPMFIGAMIMGPIGGHTIKAFDQKFEGKIKSGFEMLVNNFSAGILGAILTIVGLLLINPLVVAFTNMMAAGVSVMVSANILPAANIFIEPAKILFLNNAINHGILGPIGIEEVQQTGSSILFLLESNPGPGLGVLLGFAIFGKGSAKGTAPAAIIIHFLGGIHEIYFPYILMKPILLLSVIAGGMAGTFTFALLGAGLVATPSPGSIFAILALTPRGLHIAVLMGVLISTLVSFSITAAILKRMPETDKDKLEEAKQKSKDLKVKKEEDGVAGENISQIKNITKIIFACDAGMGSSAMGSSILGKKIKEAGLDIKVVNMSISNLPDDAQLVITHKELTERAKEKVPKAKHISVENFLNSPKYGELLEQLKIS
jgi:mannitol PTS system EIICBA or EIICB component